MQELWFFEKGNKILKLNDMCVSSHLASPGPRTPRQAACNINDLELGKKLGEITCNMTGYTYQLNNTML